MHIGIPAETLAGEQRVAGTPETVKKMLAGGHHKILVQSGAGGAASVPDSEYQAAGATIVAGAQELYSLLHYIHIISFHCYPIQLAGMS